MKTYFKSIIIITLLFITCKISFAQQESLYSQYMYNRVVINPAYAGVKGVVSLTGLFRMQWVNFGGGPRTFTFSGHGGLNTARRDKPSHGFGGFIMGDMHGAMSIYAAGVSYAFRIPVGRNGYFALGLQAGAIQWGIDVNKIRTDIPNDPTFTGSKETVIRPDIGAGLFYNCKNFYAGFSMAHLVEFDIPVTKNADQSKLRRHYFVNAGYDFRLHDNVVLTPSAMMRAVANAPINFDANLTLMLIEKFWVGGGFRFGSDKGNDIVCMAGVYPFKRMRIGYSYDFSLMPKNGINRFNDGSHEIMVSFDFGKNDKARVITPRYF